MHLNLTTVDLFWLKGVLETQSMHIYIYTYIKGREVVRCCTYMLFAFSCGCDFSLSCLILGPNAATSTALSQPLCSSASGFHLREVFSLGRGEPMHRQEHAPVCLCGICSHWGATRQCSLETTVRRDPGSSAGPTSRRT